MVTNDVYNFMNEVYRVINYIVTWERQIAQLIRSSPFLLFTFGFILLGCTCIVLGRLLSNS